MKLSIEFDGREVALLRYALDFAREEGVDYTDYRIQHDLGVLYDRLRWPYDG